MQLPRRRTWHVGGRRVVEVASSSPIRNTLLGLLLGLWAGHAAFAADEPAAASKGPSTPARGFWIAPSLSFDTTLSDLLSDSGTHSTQTLMRLTPGLRMYQRSGRLTGNLFYSTSFIGKRVDGKNEKQIQNSLDGSVQAEVVPGWGFFNGQAAISQQPLSALSQPGADGASSTVARTEIRTLRASPYAEGRLGSLAEYTVRWDGVSTRSTSALLPDSHSSNISGRIGSPKGSYRLGWEAYGSSLTSNFSGRSRSATTDQWGGQLSYSPDVDWRFFVRGGREYSDVATPTRTGYSNVGAGLQWTPSSRTRLNLERERRYFGGSHRILAEHRLARTTFRYSDSRDVINGLDSRGYGQTQSLYQLWSTQLAAAQPDPLLRDQLVRDLIRAQGRDPNELVSGSFLVPGITVQRRQELTASFQGQRMTSAVSAYRSRAQRIDENASSLPGANEPVLQSGHSFNVGWRLTPLTNTSLGLTRQRSEIVGLGASDNIALLASLSQQLGRNLYGTIGLRRSHFNSPVNSVRESAINGLLSLTF